MFVVESKVVILTETTVEVLPRLCQIKYASGTLEELLYIDMPRESKNVSGQIVLDYTKAIQESVFDQLRVVREGHLRIIFNPDLKVFLSHFCTLFFLSFTHYYGVLLYYSWTSGAFWTNICCNPVLSLLLKIASWEFCARRHEELIPRRSIIPQVLKLSTV
jgi:hypothetical protein